MRINVVVSGYRDVGYRSRPFPRVFISPCFHFPGTLPLGTREELNDVCVVIVRSCILHTWYIQRLRMGRAGQHFDLLYSMSDTE